MDTNKTEAVQPQPWADTTATERLRSIVDVLGLQSEVPTGDLTGYEFAVLGIVRHAIERLKAVAPQKVVTVDSPELLDLVQNWENSKRGPVALAAWQQLIAHIDAHVAKAVAAATSAPQPAQAALSDEQIESLRYIAQSWMTEAGRDSVEDWIAAITASHQPAAAPVQAAVVPEGWALVPRKMTDEQAREVVYNINRKYKGNPMSDYLARQVWSWAIYAKPAAPSQAQAMPEYMQAGKSHKKCLDEFHKAVSSFSYKDKEKHHFAFSWFETGWFVLLNIINADLKAQPTQAQQVAEAMPDVDTLAQFIRSVDGNHSLGAGALAEKIVEWFTTQPTAQAAPASQVRDEHEPSANEQKLSERASWTTKQWYEHVGAWEDKSDQIVFGSVMALRAMLVQFQAVTLYAAKVRQSASQHDVWSMVCGDWKDEHVALHGANGHITSGLTIEQAKALIAAHGGTPAVTALAHKPASGEA